MTPFDVLENSPFSLNNNTPPPELLNNLPQENLNLPQYPSKNQSYNNPLTNPTAAGVHRDLLNYKNLYNEAENAINFYGNYLRNGTDAEKNQAQGLINFFENQKREVSNAANMTRNIAKSLGIDTSGFESENTLEEARKNMYTNDARAIQGLLNLPSVQSQQRDYYERMKNAGLSDRLARKAAVQKHDEFRENNVNQLFNGFQNYGLNEDGTINNFGVRLLGRLTNENPQVAELFTNQFASPKDYFQEVQQNYRQNVAADKQFQLQNMSQQYDWQKTQAAQKLAWELQKDQQEHALKMKTLDAAKKGTGLEEDKLTQEISSVMRNTGLPQEIATEMVLRQHYNNSFKVPRDADGNIKISDAEKVTNYTTGRLAMIDYYLGKGDFGRAQELINNYRNALSSDEFKYAEQLDGEQITSILEILELGERVANGEITLEEMRALMNGGQGNSAADLSKVNHDGAANIKAKQIAEENKRKRDSNPKNSKAQSGLVPRIYADRNGRVHVVDNQPTLLRFVPVQE